MTLSLEDIQFEGFGEDEHVMNFKQLHIFYKLGIKDINLYLFFQVNLDSGMRFADHRARTQRSS